jgi:hypothetical protein
VASQPQAGAGAGSQQLGAAPQSQREALRA